MTEERITSRQNPILRHIRKLLNSRTYRESSGQYVGDGCKLLEEAVRWNAGLEVVVAVDGVELAGVPEDIRRVRVPADVMQSVSAMQSPQGILFVCRRPAAQPLQLHGGCLILEGIQDPGNLGTILRTADALEVPVVLTEGCADPYNPKSVRASMGAVFRTPPQWAGRGETADYCASHGIELVATSLSEDAVDIREISLAHTAVIVGSEGRGISRAFLELADRRIIIPMNARCESLNAAVAAAIVMWQIRR